jgi:hypothetical protein
MDAKFEHAMRARTTITPCVHHNHAVRAPQSNHAFPL